MALKIRQKKQLLAVADAVRLLNKDAKFIWISDDGAVWSCNKDPKQMDATETHNLQDVRVHEADIVLMMDPEDTLMQIRGE